MADREEKRDDANLKQFKSRAQQPKVLAGGPGAMAAAQGVPSPVNVFIVFDQGFGSTTDQIDDTRFKYVGTSPSITYYEGMCSRRNTQECMRSGFHW